MGMVEFRAKNQGIPGKVSTAVKKAAPRSGQEDRRGRRVNSCVPVSVEWNSHGEVQRGEARTRVVGAYGCLVVLSQHLEVKQQIQLTNLMSQQSNPAVIVWRGNQRPEGWELGIELINPQMGFWGVEL
jgi:hypothetical protein